MPKPSNKPKVRLSPFISCDDDEDKPAARSVVVKTKPVRRTNVVVVAAEAKHDEIKTKTKIIKTKTKKSEDNAEDNAEVTASVAVAKKTKPIRKTDAKTKTTKKTAVLEQEHNSSVAESSNDDESS